MIQKIDEFLKYLKNNKKVSDNTLMSYKRDLCKVVEFLENNGINSFSKVTSTNLNSYMLLLEKQGKSPATIARSVSSLNTFFRYLLVKKEVEDDPVYTVKAPRVDKKLPEILTTEEVDRLLAQPNGKNDKAIRDKALLELMYATGMRVTELINMKTEDVNIQLGYVVCKGGKKERVIPFGNKVRVVLSKYLYEVRNKEEAEEEWLFLNCFGNKMSRQGVWKIIKYYAEKAEIDKDITPHTVRHSVGAHLIKNGKAVSEVQEIMGHIDISSTSIYSNILV